MDNSNTITVSGFAQVQISQIRTDGGTQPRVAFDVDLVTEYADDMLAGDKFPAVIVYFDGTCYWLADGFHRIRAASGIGWKSIDAEIRLGTLRDAVLFSVGVNGKHGKRRTNADKRSAVEKLLKDAEWCVWSDREIARKCGVGHALVSTIRSSVTGFSSSEGNVGISNNNSIVPTERKYNNGYGTPATMNVTNIGRTQVPPTQAPYVPTPYVPATYVPATPYEPRTDGETDKDFYDRIDLGMNVAQFTEYKRKNPHLFYVAPAVDDDDDDIVDDDDDDDDDEAVGDDTDDTDADAPHVPTMYEHMLTDPAYCAATLKLFPQFAQMATQIAEAMITNSIYCNYASNFTCIQVAALEVLVANATQNATQEVPTDEK